MSDLPTGWTSATFGDVVTRMSNGMPGVQNKDGNGVPVSRIETIADQRIDFGRIGYVAEFDTSHVEKYKLLDGDVLFSHINSPTHLGKTAIFSGGNVLYHGINLLRIQVNRELITPAIFDFACKFLRYKGEFSLRAQHAVNQSSLNQSKLAAFPISLPPLAEQKRIADKLDTVLTRVDAVNTRLVRVAPLLKRFRQSVLAAAFTGRLTNVAATALPSSWQTVTLGSLITHGPKNGLYKPSSAYGDGFRILRIDSFYDGKVSDWGGLRLLSVDSSELKQFGLKNGDIVINRVNSIEYLGKCALIEGLQGECVFESNMMKFRLSSELANPHFVRAWLCSEDARTQIVGKAKHAVNQASINQSDVCSLKLQLPPLSEQTEIVRRVETLFAFADRLEARLAQAQTAATRLTPALLAKAFRGELVPQDPNDEPAAELLRRLQAQRAKGAPASKTGAGRGLGRKAAASAAADL